MFDKKKTKTHKNKQSRCHVAKHLLDKFRATECDALFCEHTLQEKQEKAFVNMATCCFSQPPPLELVFSILSLSLVFHCRCSTRADTRILDSFVLTAIRASVLSSSAGVCQKYTCSSKKKIPINKLSVGVFAHKWIMCLLGILLRSKNPKVWCNLEKLACNLVANGSLLCILSVNGFHSDTLLLGLGERSGFFAGMGQDD